MSCTIQEIKQQGIDKVKRLFKGQASSITIDNNTAIIKYGPEFRVKNREQAFNMVKSKINKIDKWSNDTFKTNAFKGQWTSLYQPTDEFRIEFTFPESLLNYYEKKLNENKEESFHEKLIVQNNNKEENFSQKFIFGNKKETKNIQDFNLNEKQRNNNLNQIREKLFNGNLTNQSANQFLRNALYNVDVNEETKQLIKSLLTTRANIKFVDKSVLVSDRTYAQYKPNSRTIELNRNILGTGDLHYALNSILHEIIHDFTVNVINNPKNDKQREFRNYINTQFEFFKALSDQKDLYGFKNEFEFVSEIMTNKAFEEHLKDLKDDSNRSILQRFIDGLRRLFNLELYNVKRVNKILESILDIVNTEYDNHNSFTSLNAAFEKQGEEKSKKNKYREEFNKELIDVKSLIKDILARIEAVKNKSRAKKGYKTDTQEKFSELQELMESLYNKSSNEALYEFTNFANKEIKFLLELLDKKIDENNITSDFLSRSNAYISVYDSLEDIRNISTRQYDNREITKDEYDKINDSLKDAKSNFEIFRARYIDLARDLQAEKLAPYNNRPLIRRKRQLEKQYNSLNISLNKEKWINDKLDEEIDELKQEALEEVRKQLEYIPMDIGSNTLTLVSEKNINNLIVQLLSLSIDNIEIELRDFITDIRNEYYNKSKEYNAKGLTNESRYSKLLSRGKEGDYYLISKYSPKFIEEYKERQESLYKVNDEYGYKSKESRKEYNKFIAWKKKNTITKKDSNGIIISQTPTDKWLDKRYSKLNNSDKSYLNFLSEKAKEADELTNGYKSLIYKYLDTDFIKLPSIRRTDLDKILSGKILDVSKEKLGDLTKIREDDTTRGELTDEELNNQNISKKMVTINNEERFLVPIHYRNKINSKDQSLDLPTIFLMNSAMAKEYNVKSNLEADTKLLIDVIAESKVTKTDAFTNKVWKSIFSNNEDELVDIRINGKDSNVYKKLNSMVQNRIYKITQVSNGKLLGKDIASIANGIGGYSAHLALAVNYLSAVPNLMQGKIQNFIEGVGNGVFSRSDLRWAEKTYFQELANGGLNDIGTNINNSKLFMLIDKFNLMGDFNAIKNKFEDSNKFRAMFKSSTLHGLNGVAEHYVQSTLMLAIMRSVKIKDSNGNYINENGKVVSKENAMNLYEAFTVEDNKLKLNDKADHSSFSRNKFSDLGILDHQSLIRKKIIDLHGQYDQRWQSDIQRYWWGKLIFMFRKWLIPAYHRRWRGMIYANKDYDELSDNQKFYDDSLQQFNEGIYTSMVRFIMTSIIPAIKEFKLELIKADWNNLTDQEKANIHKTLRELIVTAAMFTAANITYIAAKDASDEEDEKILYTLAYLFKRQETELMQYWSISDQLRIFRTPFAAMSTAEKATKWFSQIMPWNINEQYEAGANKDQYKAWIKAKRLVPVIAQTERSAKESLSYLKSISD